MPLDESSLSVHENESELNTLRKQLEEKLSLSEVIANDTATGNIRSNSEIIIAPDETVFMSIHRINCNKLKSLRLIAKNDPFVVLNFTDFVLKTRTVFKGGSGAAWDNLGFRVAIPGRSINDFTMKLEVFDESSALSNIVIGESNIHILSRISKFDEQQEIVTDISTKLGKKSGIVKLSVTFSKDTLISLPSSNVFETSVLDEQSFLMDGHEESNINRDFCRELPDCLRSFNGYYFYNLTIRCYYLV